MKKIKIRQHDIKDCGAACLVSVGNFHHIQIPIAKIRQWSDTDQQGTNILGLIQAAEKIGLDAKGIKANETALGKIPLPAIAHVILENHLHHFMVIYKFKNNKITIMDPAIGKMETYLKNDFLNIWSGALIILSPKSNSKHLNLVKSNLKRFYNLIQPHKSVVSQVIFGSILYTIIGLSIPIFIQKITDHVLGSNNKNLMNLMSVIMIILVTIQGFIGNRKSILMMKTGQLIDNQLILGYYKHLLKLPQRFFDTMRIGEITSRINDAVKIRLFVNETAIDILVNSCIVLFSCALMFTYYWKLALVIIAIIPVYIGIYILMNHLNYKFEKRIMENGAKLETQLVESVNNIRTIKEFGIQSFSNTLTENRFIKLLFSGSDASKNNIWISSIIQWLASILTIMILWIGAFSVINRIISPGELFSFYALIGFILGPIASLISANKSINSALIASDRLFEIMDLEILEIENSIKIEEQDIGDIKFENVTFAYGNRRPVFKNLNLTIEKNKTTAIVGESGCGKTTLFALIQLLYPIKEGKISIGNININMIDTKSLNSILSIIPQNLHLFGGNIIQNIALGENIPDIKRILDIAQSLGINTFIEQLPNSYLTEIGENGSQLSGGQKQRIAFARAIYKNPEILLLDEATSSLDSKSELPIKKYLEQFKKLNKTIVIIAHRLSTIKIADRIIMMNNGEISESGTHTELIQNKSHYFQLWNLQNQLI